MSSNLPIDHDLLECYVLGLCTPEETARVEALKSQFPAVAKEIQEIQSSLEVLSMSYARTPRPELKSQTWAAIQASAPSASKHNTGSEAQPTAPNVGSAQHTSTWSLGISAAVLGIVTCCSVLYAVYEYRMNNELQTQMQTLWQQKHNSEQRVSSLEHELHKNQRELEFRNSPFTHALALLNVAHSSTIIARVYLNPNDTLRFVAMASVCDAQPDDHLILWSYYANAFRPIHDCTRDAIGTLVDLESAPQDAQYLLTAERRADPESPDAKHIIASTSPSIVQLLKTPHRPVKEEFIKGEPPTSKRHR